MNQRLKTDPSRVAKNGKNAREIDVNGLAGRNSNGHAAGGRNAESARGRAGDSTNDSSRALTSLLMALARDMFSVDDAVSDLPLRQLRVCALLCDSPLSMTVLGRKSGVTLSAMTQIADRLERAGLVKRTFAGTDRRMRCLQLTPRGQRIMRRAKTHASSAPRRSLNT